MSEVLVVSAEESCPVFVLMAEAPFTQRNTRHQRCSECHKELERRGEKQVVSAHTEHVSSLAGQVTCAV